MHLLHAVLMSQLKATRPQLQPAHSKRKQPSEQTQGCRTTLGSAEASQLCDTVERDKADMTVALHNLCGCRAKGLPLQSARSQQ
jgi:hypothetical protein